MAYKKGGKKGKSLSEIKNTPYPGSREADIADMEAQLQDHADRLQEIESQLLSKTKDVGTEVVSGKTDQDTGDTQEYSSVKEGVDGATPNPIPNPGIESPDGKPTPELPDTTTELPPV